MKSYNGLWEKMIQPENVRAAFWEASIGKRSRSDVARALGNLDHHTEKLIAMLEGGTYRAPTHRPVPLREGSRGKTRYIIKPRYLYEQVVHHLIVGQIEPIILRGMYRFSCGSVPDRGLHYAKKELEKWVKGYGGHKFYVAQLDVHHFFASVDHDVLVAKLSKVIRDKRFMQLVEETIRTAGDGLPLGFYTSQWFANYYLQSLDYFILQTLKPDHYLRYMDDTILFGKNKKELHHSVDAIGEYLHEQLHIELKANWQVYRFEYEDRDGKIRGRPLDALGFVFHRNRTAMRKTILKRARRKASKLSKKPRVSWYDATAMVSYMGWFTHTDTYEYFKKYIKPCVNIRALKRKIARHARKEART